MIVALTAWVLITSALWLIGPYISWLTARAIRRLEDQPRSQPVHLPKLSVVIPACNEADTIEPALASLRAQTYRDLEIVLLDDRSNDGTGAIIDRIAGEDPRVRAVHVESLPDGWLGKVHALHRGMELATGEWVLFTDADVKFRDDVLERSVEWAMGHGVDHLFLFPRVHSQSGMVELMIGSAVRAIGLSQRPWRAADPNKEESLGGGAFNLVRRAAFDRTPGFEWLKMEVADDLGLAHMMKKFGGKPGLLTAIELLEVEWYRNLAECFRGMEKNAFAQMARFSCFRGLTIAAFAVVAALGPVAAFVVPVPRLWIAGVAAFMANFVSAFVMRKQASIRPLLLALSSPLGDLLMTVLLVRASILGWKRGALVWRGTHYPLDALRAGARIRF